MDATPLRQITEILRSMNAVAAGTTTQNGTGVDCSDCDGVLFVAGFGTITASAVTSLKAQQSSDDASADDYTDIAGSAQSVTPSTHDNKSVVLDIFRPLKRYVRPVIVRGTANAVIDGILAIKYNLRKQPASTHASIAAAKSLVSPAEGTA